MYWGSLVRVNNVFNKWFKETNVDKNFLQSERTKFQANKTITNHAG